MSNKPHARRVFAADIPFDQDCQIGLLDWPELSQAQREACENDDMVPIFDAETTVVAIVPRKYADVLLEVINRFGGDPLTDEDWKIIDKSSLDAVDRTKF